MKFTQAVVLAAVASAAVVSAVPTKGRAAGRVQKNNRGGKKSGLSSIRRFGSSALRHAGGIEGAATAAASLYTLRQSHKAQKAAEASAEAPVARAIAEPVAGTNQTATPAAATTGNGHRKKGQHKTDEHSGKRFHNRVHGAAGHVTVGKKTGNTHSQPGPAIKAAGPTTKLPAPGPITTRDLVEALDARDFGDLEYLEARDFGDLEYLEARDFGDALESLDARDAGDLEYLAARDFDLEELDARDFDLDELDARDLEVLEELIARGRFSGAIKMARKGFSAVRKAVKGHKMDGLMAAGTVASFIPSGKSKEQQQRRDLEDFDELEMRDFDLELNELD